MNRRVVLTGIAILTALYASPGSPDSSGSKRIELLQRDLSVLLQGDEAVSVEASPALCNAHNLDRNPGQDSRAWYFGHEKCRLQYPPDITALVSPATDDISKRLYESDAQRLKLEQTLSELRQISSREKLDLQEKLLLHSTAWEIHEGLKRSLQYRPERSRVLHQTQCLAFDLLRQTAFSDRELEAIPDTLRELARSAKAPQIEPIIRRLDQHDPTIVEVFSPSDLHAETMLGRFTPRIFLMLENADESEAERFRKTISSSAKPNESLLYLPHQFSGFSAILVLYFNVLTTDLRIVPTRQVAFWKQYQYSGKIEDGISFENLEKRIKFFTVAYKKNFNTVKQKSTAPTASSQILYEQEDQGSIARQTFLNVKPEVPGLYVTTLRGNCLKCHNFRVSLFQTRDSSQLGYSVPLVRQGRDLLTPYFRQTIEQEINRSGNDCK